MSGSYGERFQAHTAALAYETREYGEKTYANLIWQIERRWLAEYLAEMRANRPIKRYLDFACGTGRVLAFARPYAEAAVGIDVSESMLAIARPKVPDATLICADVTRGTAPGEGDAHYDLITAFRFLLNAEPPLQERAMPALARRLRDRDSRLILNNHGNVTSYKALSWAGKPVAGWFGERSEERFLSHRRVCRLLDVNGLAIERIYSYAFLSGHALRVLDFERLRRIEDALARYPALGPFAAFRTYVVRLR